MGKINTYLHALNVGVQDKTALARVDLERMRLAAEQQTNFMAQAVGPGFMRPGTEYLTGTKLNRECRLKEFVFGATDAAMFEFTTAVLRVLVDDEVITRPAVTSTVTNGDFSSAVGWTTTGVGGGTATISGGQLVLNANNIEGIAQCSRSVTTSTPDIEHALRIVVTRGPVTFRCGSTSGGDEYIAETVLPTGEHSLAFTPTGTYYVAFSSKARINRIVDSIQVEAAGVMELPTPWGLSELPSIRIAQSADVCFVACDGNQQRRIERRAARSWSVGLYTSDDGPFALNPEPRVRLKPSVLEGNGTLTASAAYFNTNHVGSLFRLVHTGQNVEQGLGQEDTFTDSIRITGIDAGGGVSDRDFSINITGTWVGTLTLQRSYDDPETGFVDVQTFAANTSTTFGDSADNAIYYYRIGFKQGDYTSGTANIDLAYDGGGGFGICRVIGFTSATSVSMEVLTPFKNKVYTRDWRPGEWSDDAGYPSAVALSDGRLWWFGEDHYWGSVSDAFDSFDEEVEGDSGPISRSIATGGVNDTQWALSLERLVAGTEGAVATLKSSSLDEPLTPTNIGVREGSTVGVASIDPVKVDANAIFVERAGTALMELVLKDGASNYTASEISKLTTQIFSSGVKALAIQRRPDTRVWITLEDGTAVCMLYEPDQDVLAFIPLETDGAFESVAVLPALVQDRVYFSVRRSINGSVVRYIEKMALDTEVKPSTLCKVMDAFRLSTNSPAGTTADGLSHLIGETVVAWADGAPVETSSGVPAEFVVDGSGEIELPEAFESAVVGLPYRARYKSARLAYGASGGTAMLQKKIVVSVGAILTDFVRAGIKWGRAFDDPYRALYPMPQMVNSQTAEAIVLSDIHDEEQFPFDGAWDLDSRVCMEINSPYTATVLGLVLSVETNG